jgi:hypothetical protein
MTEHTPEGGGNSLAFEKVQDRAQFERAPPAREPHRDTGGPNLAFETAPRAPLAPVTAPDPRTLGASAFAPPVQPVPKSPPYEAAPGSRSPAFEAVPVSLGVAQQRLSTATIGIRPEVVEVAGSVTAGGAGWNIRRRDGGEAPNRGRPEGDAPPAWETRTLPNAHRDRSAWTVPEAPRTRTVSGRMVMGVVFSLVLVATLGFAGYEWLAGRAQPDHTITTPPSVGTLTAMHTPATAAVTEQMQKVMQQYGATHVVSGVYGAAGRAQLVVLLAQGPDIEKSTNQFFNDFTSGLKTQGVAVISSKRLNTATDGSDFVCSAATGPAPLTALSLCGWDDGDTIGLVVDVSGQAVSATLREAEAARTAGEH